MLDAQDDVFYYVTVMNENYSHPPMPKGAREGILNGMYLLRGAKNAEVQLLGSGAILRECLAAADELEHTHGVAANVWSVTSWSELRWDGMLTHGASNAVREVRGEPSSDKPWIAQCLEETRGPIIAASDYVSALADLVRPYAPAGRPFVALGTDGYGRSDTRAALRSFFAVDLRSIVRAALAAKG
jgi:pyruvate dehydrogenase E1 component